MLYVINSKYYIKRRSFFVEVDVDVVNNDVILKPTDNKLDLNNVEYEVVSYETLKKEKLSNRDTEEEKPKLKSAVFSKKGNYSSKKY